MADQSNDKPVEVKTQLETLRLSFEEYTQLIAVLDKEAANRPEVSMRSTARATYVLEQPLVLEVATSEKEVTRYLVRPRNIAAGGAAVLHGGFIHFKTRCTIALRNLEGKHVMQTGIVRHASLIKGHIHEIGIQFDEPVDVSQFVADAPAAPVNPTTDQSKT